METASAFSQRLRKKTEHLAQKFPVPDVLSEERRRELDAEMGRLIGHTRLQFIPVGRGGIFLKRETDNPSETHYDRAFPTLIRSLESRKKIIPGITKELIETSSGSAGPSFAWIAKAYGYRTKVFLPRGLPAARINVHRETADEVVISPNENYLEGMVETLQEMTNTENMRAKLISKEVVVLNHSRRKETPQAFQAIGKEVIEQLPPDVELDTFVCAIGNGTTIAGIGEALRQRFSNIFLHGFEENLGGLYGATGAGSIDMPFVRRDTLNRITAIERNDYEEAIETYNQGKEEAETVGRTTVVGLRLAQEMIENREATFALVLAYDNLGRYDRIITKKDSMYLGKGLWSEQ